MTDDLASSPYPLSGMRFEGKHPKLYFFFFLWKVDVGLLHCRHSLPAKPPGKLKNTGVDSLSLLQGIFSTQELNWDLLHYRRIFYQLSYQGSPRYRYIDIQLVEHEKKTVT